MYTSDKGKEMKKMIEQMIEQYKDAGYTEVHEGKPLTCSELAMSMGIAGRIPSLVLVKPERGYAMIVIDEKITSGIYHEFDDSMSLA